MELNWSKIWDWTVVDVQGPYPIQTGNNIFAYCVDVMYRHHGLRRVVFPVERDRILISGQDMALSNANVFFGKMSARIQRNTKKR